LGENRAKKRESSEKKNLKGKSHKTRRGGRKRKSGPHPTQKPGKKPQQIAEMETGKEKKKGEPLAKGHPGKGWGPGDRPVFF